MRKDGHFNPLSSSLPAIQFVKAGPAQTHLSPIRKASSQQGGQAPSHSSSPDAASVTGAAPSGGGRAGHGHLRLIPGPGLSPDGALASASRGLVPTLSLVMTELQEVTAHVLAQGPPCNLGRGPSRRSWRE